MPHQCLLPYCEAKADDRYAICGDHYRMLPAELRYAITRAWIPDMTEETMTIGMRNAITDARAWILKTFGDVPRERWDPGKWERLVRHVRERDAARKKAGT